MREGTRWIEAREDLAALAAGIGAGPLGVDTEADSFHRYRERLCLLQICDGDRVWIVDPLALVDLSPLRGILEEPARRKVVHGGDYDVRLLRRDHGISPRGLFDTMIAARLCGERVFGLSALLSARLGVSVDKGQQRADWARRPLPEKMLEYAAEDTRHLVRLAEILENELVRLGRERWAEEEFRRLEDVRWSEDPPDPDRWRRVRGSTALDRRGLGVVRAAWTWREDRARRLDRPPFRVVRDEVLLEIARVRTDSAAVLSGLGGAPRSWRDGGGGIEDLRRAVAEALAAPEESLPEPKPAARRPRDPAFESRVHRLKAHRDSAAGRFGLEGSLVASRSALESLQRALDRGDGPSTVPELREWQREVLGPLEAFAARL